MKDAESIGSVITALYGVVSGPAGKTRDWQRNKALFYPGARSVRTFIGPDGRPRALSMSPDEYAANVQPMLDEHSFYEVEIARREFHFGNIAHALSTYESRRSPDDPKPFGRGVNSLQFFHDGVRWWVLSIVWDNERPDNPIPEELLPDAD